MAKNLKDLAAERAEKKAKAKTATKKASAKKSTTTRKTTSTATKKATSTATKSTTDKVKEAVSGLTTTNKTPTAIKSEIPGLSVVKPTELAGMMPQFNPNQYDIADPLHPNPEMPQLNEGEHRAAIAIYEGTERALDVTGKAFDITKKRFQTEQKRVSAFGAGINLAKEFEKTQGLFYDYQSEVEATEQKRLNLGHAQYKTQHVTAMITESETELDAKLTQARVQAEFALEQSRQKESELETFKQSLIG